MLPHHITRFWSRVEFTDTCWLWKGNDNGSGYGIFYWMIDAIRYQDTAHRIAFAFCVGPVPKGLELDHLCRVRHCLNPDHLEAVTRRVNQRRGNSVSGINARKTVCKHGHPFDDENTYIRPDGTGRDCRACRRRTMAHYWATHPRP